MDLASHRKGDSVKVTKSRRLRRATPMTLPVMRSGCRWESERKFQICSAGPAAVREIKAHTFISVNSED
jgi:hypothetical protein